MNSKTKKAYISMKVVIPERANKAVIVLVKERA